ncbi:MAG: 30S ribosomal protein S5 [bacterium]|jgi:small subunit ribosomal protein S5|nr:30S ribosomal protein S5 [bacterium]
MENKQNQNTNFKNPAGGRGRNFRGPRRDSRGDFKQDSFKEKVLDLRRVTRVVAGGKRFRFRVTLVIGDEKGSVGVGVAKGLDVQSAIEKSKRDARKNVIKIPLNKRTIPHEVRAKFSAADVLIKPAVEGHGLKAGGAVRVVLSLAGIKDVTAKCLGRTPNKLTNAMATIKALSQLKVKSEKL